MDIPAGSSSFDGLRVLIVEDDASIATQLARGLGRAGCRVTTVNTAAKALAAEPVDLVILDLGLPDMDGTEVCSRLRATGDIPIVVVTARSGEGDKVAALDLGADDYLAKPFGFAELTARMRAVLRRSRSARVDQPIQHGSLRVDLAGRRVEVAGAEIVLTAKEFGILSCLAAEPGRVVTREEIFAAVWDEHWYGPTRVLDVHMVSLRRKLGDPNLIETVYGVGFRLGPP